MPSSSFPFYEIMFPVSLFIVRFIATLHFSLQVKTFFTIVYAFVLIHFFPGISIKSHCIRIETPSSITLPCKEKVGQLPLTMIRQLVKF